MTQYDQDRIDTLTANYIARIYKAGDEVDHWTAFLEVPGQEEQAADVMRIAMEWLQNRDEREELALKGWAMFMEAVRANCEDAIKRQLWEEESQQEADPVRYIHGVPEDEYLDDPRRGQAAYLNRVK